MAEAAKDPVSIAAIASVLGTHTTEAATVSEYVTRSRLHPSLQPLFPM